MRYQPIDNCLLFQFYNFTNQVLAFAMVFFSVTQFDNYTITQIHNSQILKFYTSSFSLRHLPLLFTIILSKNPHTPSLIFHRIYLVYNHHHYIFLQTQPIVFSGGREWVYLQLKILHQLEAGTQNLYHKSKMNWYSALYQVINRNMVK